MMTVHYLPHKVVFCAAAVLFGDSCEGDMPLTRTESQSLKQISHRLQGVLVLAFTASAQGPDVDMVGSLERYMWFAVAVIRSAGKAKPCKLLSVHMQGFILL